MSMSTPYVSNEIWQAAKFITEWDHDGLRWKALEVPRDAIDTDCDEPSALLIIGIDSGNVRRAEDLFDPAFHRMNGADKTALRDLMLHAPQQVVGFGEQILAAA